MDTYKQHNIENEDISVPEFADISEHDAEIFERLVSLDGVLQEVEQLNQVFLYNVKALSDRYRLTYDDHVYDISTGKEIDKYVLNALFINIISSGKTLIDKAETVLEYDLKENRIKEFRELYSSDIYDRIFAYRFFVFLRNISQHVSIPVSQKLDGVFCFDLVQIKGLRHMNKPNAAMRNEIQKIIKEITTRFRGQPDICFTQNVDDYVKSVFEIYYRFLAFVRPELAEAYNNAVEVLKNNPQYICQKGSFKGWVCYKIVDGNAQLFPSSSDSLGAFSHWLSEAKLRYNNYDNEFHKNQLKCNINHISIVEESTSLSSRCPVLQFGDLGDERGKLVVIEGGENIPFSIARVFYIYGSDDTVVRGQHANRESEFVLINVAGKSKVRLTDGKEEHIVSLDMPRMGIYIPKMIWKEMYDFSPDSVLLVLASTHYSGEEYIRNYDDYLREIAND